MGSTKRYIHGEPSFEHIIQAVRISTTTYGFHEKFKGIQGYGQGALGKRVRAKHV